MRRASPGIGLTAGGDTEDGSNRWKDGCPGVGCLMTLANLILLSAYVVTLIWSAKWTLGLLDRLLSRL